MMPSIVPDGTCKGLRTAFPVIRTKHIIEKNADFYTFSSRKMQVYKDDHSEKNGILYILYLNSGGQV